jgi:hypothetical protein
MGSFSDWLEDEILNHVFKNTSMSQPTKLFIALTESTIAVWGTITDFAIVDSGTAAQGNMFGFGKVTTSKKIATGDTAKFATGDIDVTLN